MPHRIIAIDGPAASGKSTVARRLAARLGFLYVNTGAMYRAVTWLALRQGIRPEQPGAAEAIIALLEKTPIECGTRPSEAPGPHPVQESALRIEGIDPAPFLNTAEVAANVSHVAAIARVREILVARQREYSRTHDLVMEGRDIGTVVFPQTPHKFYISASAEIRARRRAAQGLADDPAARDKLDSTRATAPLQIAPGATIIDNSALTIEETVEAVARHLA